MEHIISSSSSSSFLCPSPIIQQRLQFILQNRPEWWTYSIFWQTSVECATDRFVLSWGDGQFRGSRDFRLKYDNAGSPSIYTSNELDSDFPDSERFFMVSVTRSFMCGDDDNIVSRTFSSGSHAWLVGDQELQLSACNRAKEAFMHGVKTLVCVSTPSGIIELGSSYVIKEDWGLVHLVKYVFSPDSTNMDINYMITCPPTTHHHAHPNQNPSLSFLDMNDGFPGDDIKSTNSYEKEHNIVKTLKMAQSFSDLFNSDFKLPLDRSSKKRVRRTVASGKEVAQNNMEAERMRRDKLNHRFYALRSVVPNVSRMDKASLLEDAVTYIKELKSKVEELDGKLREEVRKSGCTTDAIYHGTCAPQSTSTTADALTARSNAMNYGRIQMEVDIKILGSQAMIHVQSPDINYPWARLMDALRMLKFRVHHASVSSVKDLILQDVVIKVPDGLTNEEGLKSAILGTLQI